MSALPSRRFDRHNELRGPACVERRSSAIPEDCFRLQRWSPHGRGQRCGHHVGSLGGPSRRPPFSCSRDPGRSYLHRRGHGRSGEATQVCTDETGQALKVLTGPSGDLLARRRRGADDQLGMTAPDAAIACGALSAACPYGSRLGLGPDSADPAGHRHLSGLHAATEPLDAVRRHDLQSVPIAVLKIDTHSV